MKNEKCRWNIKNQHTKYVCTLCVNVSYELNIGLRNGQLLQSIKCGNLIYIFLVVNKSELIRRNKTHSAQKALHK